jgi:hypothetical protein
MCQVEKFKDLTVIQMMDYSICDDDVELLILKQRGRDTGLEKGPPLTSVSPSCLDVVFAEVEADIPDRVGNVC